VRRERLLQVDKQVCANPEVLGLVFGKAKVPEHVAG
jgi:hypothetical protein